MRDVWIVLLVALIAGMFVFAYALAYKNSPMEDYRSIRTVCEEKGGVYTHGTIVMPEKCVFK